MKQTFTLFLLITSICFSQDFWQPTNGPMGKINFSSLVINSEQEIFVRGEDGIYKCSSNLEEFNKVSDVHYELIAVNSKDEIFAESRNTLYRSSDNCKNWDKINSGLELDNIVDLSINGADQLFVASLLKGVYRSVDNGQNWTECNQGIKKIDMGDPDSTYYLTAINIDIIRNVIYVGALYGDYEWGLYYSEDNGDNWTSISYDYDFYSEITTIATSPQGQLFASSESTFLGTHYEIYKYIENENNWIKLLGWPQGRININSNGDIFISRDFNRYDPKGDGLYRSTDNGVTWTQLTPEQGVTHDLYFGVNQEVFMCGSNGISYSNDNGDSWTQKGIDIAPTTVTCIDITADNKIIVGTYWGDGIFLSDDNGENWQQVYNGLPYNSNVWSMLVTSKEDIFILGNEDYEHVMPYRSQDNGYSWTEMSNGLPDGGEIGCLLELNDGDILFGNSKGIYISSDDGESWIEKNNGLPELNQYGDSSYPTIQSALVNSVGDILIGTDNGIYRSSDHCETWVKQNSGLPEEREISCFIENVNGDLFAGCRFHDQIGSAGVFRSTDNGNTWEKINNGFSDSTDVWCMANTSDGAIVIGTKDQGVFYSNDNGDNWKNISEGLPFEEYGGESGRFIISLLVDSEDYLYAGTYENGVYRSLNPVTSVEDNSFTKDLPNSYNLSQNYPNPFNPSTVIKYSMPNVETLHATSVQLVVYDILGQEVATLVNEKQKPGFYEVNFNADRLTSGIYFYKLQTAEFIQTKKMLLMK